MAIVIALTLFFIFAPVQVLVRSVARRLVGRRVGISSWRALKWSSVLSAATRAIFLDQLWLLVGWGRFILGPILGITICISGWQAYRFLWKDWDNDEKFKSSSFWFLNFVVSLIVCVVFFIWLKIIFGSLQAAI